MTDETEYKAKQLYGIRTIEFGDVRRIWGDEPPPPPTFTQRVRATFYWHGPMIAITGMFLVVVIVVGHSLSQKREAFMHECLQDRKQYECTALYDRGGSSVVLAPVPVRVR